MLVDAEGREDEAVGRVVSEEVRTRIVQGYPKYIFNVFDF